MNPTLLLAALENFATTIGASQQHVRDAYGDLDSAYRALRDAWEGEGADEFFNAWSTAGDAIVAYTDQMPALAALLESKVDELRRFDAGAG